MVSLFVPPGGQDLYVFWNSWIIGPYTDVANMPEPVPVPAFGRIVESPGIWHENNVSHDKFTGDIEYHPGLAGAIYSPTQPYPYYPNRVIVKGKNYLQQDSSLTANNGLAAVGYAFYKGSLQTWGHYGIMRDPALPGGWIAYEIGGVSPNWCQQALKKTILSVKYNQNGYFDITYRTTLLDERAVSKLINWEIPQSKDVFLNVATSLPLKSTSYTSSLRCTWIIPPAPKTMNMSEVTAQVDTLIAQMMEGGFPLPDVPYGDLAMEATEGTRACSVNMLEFLRDLRDIKGLILKLRNLGKLRGAASEFLKLHYGVLPTISDLSDIVGSFRRMKPYLDRNNFKVYTARNEASLDSGNDHYWLLQHIKVAVEDEDDEFQALLERLDSMGVLPTFERIWDMVRYSFVVDWFVDVGGFLERIDTRLRLSRLNIKYVTMSRKTSVTKTLALSALRPFSGTITWVQYHRWVTDHCPVPPLSPQQLSNPLTHWVEAGALLVQRT